MPGAAADGKLKKKKKKSKVCNLRHNICLLPFLNTIPNTLPQTM